MKPPITLTGLALWIGAASLTVAQTGGRIHLDPKVAALATPPSETPADCAWAAT
jgi:hypothetical protein